MPTRVCALLAATLCSLLAAGCGGSGILVRPFLQGAAAGTARQWTVMVYMDADGDLEEYGILNLNQMERVGSTPGVAIVVQFDRAPGFDSSNGDWTDTRRFYVSRDDDDTRISSPLLEDLGEVDMGQPASLREFVQWAASRYPAQHYLLVLWNHGAGWRSPEPRAAPALAAAKARGILFDDTSSSYLTLAQLDAALDAPVHLDLIAMDASLMGMLEVAYEIRTRADYLAFSEESPPGRGYPYDRILARLSASPGMTPEELGRVFVEEYVAAYPTQPVTQSLVRTDRIPELARRTDALAGALLPLLPDMRSRLDQARLQTQAYAYSYYRDLYDFAAQVQAAIPDSGVPAAAAGLIAGFPGAAGGPVIAEAHGPVGVERSHGLSIYLPGPGELLPRYDDLAFTRDFPRWNTLLQRWLNGQAR